MTLLLPCICTRSALQIKTVLAGVVLLLLQVPAYRSGTLPEEKTLSKKESATETGHLPGGEQSPGNSALLIPFLLAKSDTGSHAIHSGCTAVLFKNHPCTIHF